jgi:hypothetical protein
MAKTTTRTTTTRTDKAKGGSARSAKTTDVEVVEESSGLGFEGGVAIITALLLVAAWILIDHELGAMNQGLFFKG